MNHVILCGSPRTDGTCARISEGLASLIRTTSAGDSVQIITLAGQTIAGCDGCDACRDGSRCVHRDAMDRIAPTLDWADILYVVSPVYFAGAPSQFKALLDRLQPHYWKGTRSQVKRPFYLFAVGDGGDPWGFDPLVTTCRSALGVAGFILKGNAIDCVRMQPAAALDAFCEAAGIVYER